MTASSTRPVAAVAERLYTIPVTCCLDDQAHDVTDESDHTHRTLDHQRVTDRHDVMNGVYDVETKAKLEAVTLS